MSLLSRVCQSVSAETRRTSLRECLHFTTHTRKGEASLTIHATSGLDFETFIHQVRQHPDFITDYVQEDLVLVLDLMHDMVSRGLYLDHLDMIQIQKGGIPLLQIHLISSSSSGKSMVLDLSDFRRDLLDRKAEARDAFVRPLLISVASVSLVVALLAIKLLATKLRK